MSGGLFLFLCRTEPLTSKQKEKIICFKRRQLFLTLSKGRVEGDLLFRYSDYVSLIILWPSAFGAVVAFRYFLGPQRSYFHSPFSLCSGSAFWIHNKLLRTCLPHTLAISLALLLREFNAVAPADTHLSRTLKVPKTSVLCLKEKWEVLFSTTTEKDLPKNHIRYKQMHYFGGERGRFLKQVCSPGGKLFRTSYLANFDFN